ncbi:MAG TPA: hypothetical protein VHE82_02265 [Gemmatimonadaceae bacterium]|nr:hypothetical protein [Gemmatimonadaceae bacterium]
MRIIFVVLLAAAALALGPQSAGALPSWARKYNMNCSGCHYPTVPRLNATGLAFKWAGYRMPADIGKNAEVKKIEEYLAARGIVRYVYTKTETQLADTNSLFLPSASLFAAGSIGTNYGAFVEFERTPEATIDLIGQIIGVWGKENGFGGVRVGQGHMIVGGAVAGFDRPTGILAPLALDEPTTPGVPFRFAGDVAGIEGFYVFGGMNRTSVQFVNSLAGGGNGMDAATSTTSHDWVVTNQLMLDDVGAALMAVGYFGSVTGLDSLQAGLKSRYYRIGLSANKFVGPFEGQAGYVYSNNSRLPTGPTSSFTSAKISGAGYWLYGGYTVKPSYWTVYGRYEFLDPDRALSDDALRRVVVGSVLPVNVPEYIRLGLEYFLDTPQGSGALKRQGASAEVHIAF